MKFFFLCFFLSLLLKPRLAGVQTNTKTVTPSMLVYQLLGFGGFDLTVEFVFPTSTTSTMVRVGRHASQCLFVFVSAAASEFDFNTRGVV